MTDTYKDETKEITFTVTQEHLDKGVPCQMHCCPVALALKDIGYENAYVNGSYIEIFDGDTTYGTVDLSNNLTMFIYRIDGNIPVQPETFTIEVEKV